MNKYVLALSICFLSSVIQAQPKFGLGGGIGLNFSSLATNYDIPDQSATGFHIGAIGTVAFGKHGNLFLVGGLEFNQKGGTNLVSGANSTSYIDVPVMLRHTITIKKDFPLQVFLNIGPYLGLKLARSVVNAPNSPYADSTHSTNTLEFGLAAGGGLLYPLGNGNIFLEARYSFALSSMISETLERNRVTTISAGYIYFINGKTQEQKDKTIDSGFE